MTFRCPELRTTSGLPTATRVDLYSKFETVDLLQSVLAAEVHHSPANKRECVSGGFQPGKRCRSVIGRVVCVQKTCKLMSFSYGLKL